MFIFGTRSNVVNLGPSGTRHCAVCGTDRPFQSMLRYQYFHLSFLFRFVTSKAYGITCATCGRGEAIPTHEAEAKLPRNPIPAWTRYSWVLFALLVLGFGAVEVGADLVARKETIAYQAAPAPKDLYVLDLSKVLKDPPSSPMYTILRIEAVGPQAITFRPARTFYDLSSGAMEDAKSSKVLQPEYFAGETQEWDKARVQSLRVGRILTAVVRR